MKLVSLVFLFVALARADPPQLVRKSIFVSRLLSWNDAQEYCRRYYEDLLTINTPWDYVRFKKDAAPHFSDQCWVGLSKDSKMLAYTTWSDGSALGIPLWKFGEPNDLQSCCVTIKNMELEDCDCMQSLNFFCYTWVPQMVLVEQMMTWEEALKYCRTHHTDLISVNTENDLRMAKSMSMTSQTLSVWTGLRFMNGLWFWVNQDPLGDVAVMSTCPIRPFHCGALKAEDGVWESRDCNEKMNFLCT